MPEANPAEKTNSGKLKVVSSLDGNEPPLPQMNTELKQRSEERMRSFMKAVQRREGVVGDYKVPQNRPGATQSGANGTSASAKLEQPNSEGLNSTGNGTSADAAQELNNAPVDENKAEAIQRKEDNQEAKLEYYKRKASEFQSKADKLQAEYDKLQESTKGKRIITEDEYKELASAKERVDSFMKDPVGFISQYMPSLASKLSSAGDPVKMIEGEVAEFRNQLLEQFRNLYGEDWNYNPAEADEPGTPSFKYRIAIADKIDEARAKHRQYVEQQAETIRRAEEKKRADIEKLKSEFGFTDEDIQKGEKLLNETGVSYYNLMRLALLDDIIQKKLSAIPPTPQPPRDLAQSPSTREGKAATKKAELSDEAKFIAARFGKRLLEKAR